MIPARVNYDQNTPMPQPVPAPENALAAKQAGPGVSEAAGAGALAATGFGLPGIGTALAVGGMLYNIFGQRKARKAAQKAQEKERKQAAFTNLLRVIGGGMPQDAPAQGVVPEVNYSGAVAGIGQALAQLGVMDASTKQNSWENSLKERETKVKETAAATDKTYKETLAEKEGKLTPYQASQLLISNAKANKPDKIDQLTALVAKGQGKELPQHAASAPALPPKFVQELYSILGLTAEPAAGVAPPPSLMGGTQVRWNN